ncbi:MAG: 1-deoxy-D-xylulose-5-phosphate reductoisomerase [Alkaliphilus sp.]|nr:1-deoxy-D-xylulose-5-phosphate reductoisomerase [Alkaliphilus transvaalensis]PHS35282.1 MAG: 1-deoxy-D-xylulose-5-phosphate reductoisomerase [Alkaliphilus sp.]
MKKISILGSTGSIGLQTVEIVREHLDKFKIIGIAAMSNIEKLEEQINEFKPEIVAVFNEEKAKILASKINEKTKIVSGMQGLIEVATHDRVDIVLNSVVGSVGMIPTYHAILSKKNIALANKETLVVAGKIIMQEAIKNNVSIIPVDSEHSAIFQCLQGESVKDIEKIILTASGGPFRKMSKENLKSAKYYDALKHPNWDMGRKISIDSATLMNKGLEVIEAKWLFDISCEDIDVVVHPQSIIHSMVEFSDSSVIAQMGLPSMKLPIQYALTYPTREKSSIPKLKLSEIRTLTFEEPDLDRFPCLQLAYDAIKIGGTMPCVLNGANEVLVSKYLKEEISFYDIPKYVEKAMNKHSSFDYTSLDELLEVDKWVRNWIMNELK